MRPGQENLIPIPERTKDEQREITQKGGIASGKARREKSNLRKALATVLSLEVPIEEIRDELEASGIETTMEQALAFRVIKRALLAGDYQALKTIMAAVGEHTDDEAARIEKMKAEAERARADTARKTGKQGAEIAEKQTAAIADMINSPEAERALEDYLGGDEPY